MKKNKTLSLTIGIPAYNEEANIQNLISSIEKQYKANYTIKKIVIVSDGSTDETATIVKSVRNKNIKLITGNTRRGKAYRLNQLIKQAAGDYLILIDADCLLKENALAEFVLEMTRTNRQYSLVAGNAVALLQETLLEKILLASIELKYSIIENWKQGSNIYAFRGSFMGIDKKLYQQLRLPDTIGTDAYLYLFAITKGHKVGFLKSLHVYYRLPTTLHDHSRQSIRFSDSIHRMESFFGPDIIKEYKIPKLLVLNVFTKQFIKKPVPLLLYAGLFIFIRIQRMLKKKSTGQMWEIATSTKKLGASIPVSKKKISVTIGIPTLNADKNIAPLLNSLITQSETNYSIKKIIVYSDGSTDGTVKEARKLKDKRIRIIDSHTRHGMAFGLKTMLDLNKSDVFILLNDDILIKDQQMIEKFIAPFHESTQIGLVSGNPQPLRASNFIESAGISTFRAYEKIRYSFNDGHNKHTCDGKMLALSKKFIHSLRLPEDNKKMGNVDTYLYFSAITKDFLYRHSRQAVAFFSFPSTLADYIRWNTRNNMNKPLLTEEFGPIVDDEFRLPKRIYYSSLAYEFIKNPVGAVFIFIVGVYCKAIAKKKHKHFSPRWDVVSSTKKKLVGLS